VVLTELYFEETDGLYLFSYENFIVTKIMAVRTAVYGSETRFVRKNHQTMIQTAE